MSSRPKIREGAGLQKIFSALRASVWSKTMGGGGGGGPLLDPPLKPMCDPPRDFRECGECTSTRVMTPKTKQRRHF